MKLDQKELQRKSEQLKQNKIKQIKDEVKSCLKVFELAEEIENIILDYSFDESTIETNDSLRAKLNEYCKTKKGYLINELDVSCVTSMHRLFYEYNMFNRPLNKWDTSNVVDMSFMFSGCYRFNQVVNFNTSKVIDMQYMFYWCIEFNQSIDFDTSNVTNMQHMFYMCVKFNQMVNFNIANVTNMRLRSMFSYCNSLEEKNKMLIKIKK